MIATASGQATANPLRTELGWTIDGCRAPRVRPISRFAEEEIIFPTGPFAGRHFSRDRQPFAGLYLDAIDEAHRTGRWNRIFITGPTQTGKSVLGFVAPCLYHIFELRETVVLGVPDMELVADKWREDIQPAIECTRYREQLPREGAGSRGGKVEAIRFRNGATLRFMTAGGGDKARASFTSRVLVVTETDGFDVIGGTSREGDKFSQLEARLKAFGRHKYVYAECTVSIAEGRTWREYQAGTASRIIRPCPHCGVWVTPERKDLHGWQDAETVVQARRSAYFACPECAHPWTEEERRAANLQSKLLHRGQTIDGAGAIHGDLPETDTLGFRWSAVDNHFASAGDVGADEWTASREENEENVERRLCQFTWAVPPSAMVWQDAPVTAEGIIGRAHGWPAKLVPEKTTILTVGWDLHKWTIYWVVMAWLEDGRGHVVDYGKQKTEADMLGTEKAVYAAMEELAKVVETGWTWEGHPNPRIPDQVWYDSGWLTDVMYAFARSQSDRFRPTKGLGAGQLRRQHYRRPKQTTNQILLIGDGWHITHIAAEQVFLVEVDANAWKSWSHARLIVPLGQPGAVTLYQAPPRSHLDFARQLTAEKEEETFEEGRGNIRVWVPTRSNNHWLDCYYNACAAANFAGFTLLPQPEPPPAPPKRERQAFETPDGRPYFVTQR